MTGYIATIVNMFLKCFVVKTMHLMTDDMAMIVILYGVLLLLRQYAFYE